MTLSKKQYALIVFLVAVVVTGVILLVVYLPKSKYEYDVISNTCVKSKAAGATTKSDCELKIKNNVPAVNTVLYKCDNTSGECKVSTASGAQSELDCTTSCKKIDTSLKYICSSGTCQTTTLTGNVSDTLADCTKICKPVVDDVYTFFCNPENKQCEKIHSNTGAPTQENCQNSCTCRDRFSGDSCSVYTLSLPEAKQQNFQMAMNVEKACVVLAHVFVTVDAFTVPNSCSKIHADFGCHVKIGNGSGQDSLLPGLVLIETSEFTDKIPGMKNHGNVTNISESDAVNAVMNNPGFIVGFNGKVPSQSSRSSTNKDCTGWIIDRSNHTYWTREDYDVIPGKTYIVAVYLGVATNDTIYLDFRDRANTITFLT
jgi:hypothetical protein